MGDLGAIVAGVATGTLAAALTVGGAALAPLTIAYLAVGGTVAGYELSDFYK